MTDEEEAGPTRKKARNKEVANGSENDDDEFDNIKLFFHSGFHIKDEVSVSIVITFFQVD